MENISISCVDASSPKYAQIWDLRDAVLRKPLGRSLKDDDLSRDFIDTFFIAEYQGRVIGCVLLHRLSNEDVQLRAMAVYNEWQGKGIGRLLVQAFEQHALQEGYHKIILHARKVALGFYSSLGYAVTSNEFTEVGIPHYMMEKILKTA